MKICCRGSYCKSDFILDCFSEVVHSDDLSAFVTTESSSAPCFADRLMSCTSENDVAGKIENGNVEQII